MRISSLSLFSIFASIPLVSGHARWKCPSARDEKDGNGLHIPFANTGNKYGPCGPYSGMFGMNGITELKPGPLTVEWEESIAHKGSPFRLAILDEKEEVRVVLLDHIPHWDDAKAMAYVESTYVPYKITVDIPDIKCDNCCLQLLYFMTDKSTKCGTEICTYYPEDSACSGQLDASEPTCFGAPNEEPCQKPNTCFSNYHSCTDVRILGSNPPEKFDMDMQPEDWPYKKLPMGQYGSEAAQWKDGWLVGIPRNFTLPAGDLC